MQQALHKILNTTKNQWGIKKVNIESFLIDNVKRVPVNSFEVGTMAELKSMDGRGLYIFGASQAEFESAMNQAKKVLLK